MKTNRDYSARVQECMLLFLTNAAFLLNLSQSAKDEPLSKLLYSMSEISEKCALMLFDMLYKSDETHLNPALSKKPSGDWAKDLRSAKSDAFRIHRLLLLLSAYAPDPAARNKIMKIFPQSRTNAHILSILS
ncbi:MAG: hypothetical protein IKJ65_07960 [Clostridia bacterium]|nr:hypothetical protein [Clostridia bacterium]